MAQTIICPANQSKGPFAIPRNSIVQLSVTSGGSAYVTYAVQPVNQQSVWKIWPQGVVTTVAPITDVAEKNYLATVTCTAGTANFQISDPDAINTLPINDWQSQADFPLINSSFAGLVAGNNGSTISWVSASTASGIPGINSSVAAEFLTNNGTTASWGNIPNALPTVTPATSSYGLVSNGSTSGWTQYLGWYVVATTFSGAGVQGAVDTAVLQGFNTVLLIPNTTYTFGTTQVLIAGNNSDNLSIRVPNIVCPGMCYVDNSGQTTPTGSFLFQGGQGTVTMAEISGITFKGGASSVAIEIDSFYGLRIRRCVTSGQSTFVWFHNSSASSSVEHNVIEKCQDDGFTKRFAKYSVESGATQSFHGSGLGLGNILQCVTNSPARILIDSGLVYNAPLNCNIFTILTSTGVGGSLVENNSVIASYSGSIETESLSSKVLTLGTGSGATGFAGTVVRNAENAVIDGNFKIASNIMLTSSGGIEYQGRRFAQTLTLTAGTPVTALNGEDVLGGCLINVWVVGDSNAYRQQFQLYAVNDFVGNWCDVRNVGGINTNSRGATMFSMASGVLSISAPSTGSGYSAYIDAVWIGQNWSHFRYLNV